MTDYILGQAHKEKTRLKHINVTEAHWLKLKKPLNFIHIAHKNYTVNILLSL